LAEWIEVRLQITPAAKIIHHHFVGESRIGESRFVRPVWDLFFFDLGLHSRLPE